MFVPKDFSNLLSTQLSSATKSNKELIRLKHQLSQTQQPFQRKNVIEHMGIKWKILTFVDPVILIII